MSPKSLLVFSLVTAVLVVAAAVSVANRPTATVIPKDRPFVFEGLGEQLNDAFSVEIQTAQRTFTIARVGKGWGVADLKGCSSFAGSGSLLT